MYLDPHCKDFIEYKEFLVFCKQYYGQKTEDYQQRIRLSLINVKEYCKKTGKPFITFMGRCDTGNGFVARDVFTQQMRNVLPNNLNEINMLANCYSQPHSLLVDYRRLNDDLTKLDDSTVTSKKALIASMIWNHKVEMKQTLFGIFEANSVKGIMSMKEMSVLLAKCGMTDPSNSRQYGEVFIKSNSHQHGNMLSFFDFVSAFDRKVIEMEIALLLRRHQNVWLGVKQAVEKTFNSKISTKYASCSTTATLVQELEKLPGMEQRKVELIDMIRIFSDPVLGHEKVDRHALKLADDLVNAASFQMFVPQQKVETATAVVPGSKLTFNKLKSLRKFIVNLDEGSREYARKPLLKLFELRDKNKTGRVTVEDF